MAEIPEIFITHAQFGDGLAIAERTVFADNRRNTMTALNNERKWWRR
jgi:hypothetical protein